MKLAEKYKKDADTANLLETSYQINAVKQKLSLLVGEGKYTTKNEPFSKLTLTPGVVDFLVKEGFVVEHIEDSEYVVSWGEPVTNIEEVYDGVVKRYDKMFKNLAESQEQISAPLNYGEEP